MQNLNPAEKKIADFIYEKPEIVVKLLQKYGYDIYIDTATLSQINELTFKAIYVDSNNAFAKDFDDMLASGGELNFVMVAITVASSIVSGFLAQGEAEKNRKAQYAIALANLSSSEKLATEKLRSETETARTGILANSLLEYRKTLQSESTARLKDTWLYVTGIGIGLGILFGLSLLSKEN
ncbi:MAG: hypothetical protein WCJ62_11940 [Flavobacterium sp.]